MKKYLTKTNILLASILLVAIAIATTVWSIYTDSVAIGNKIGGTAGSVVGKGLGSIEGYSEGYEEGKEAAINESIVEVDISGRIKDMGTIEVLEIDFQSKDVRTIGPEDNPDYAILFARDGRAIYTIDLYKCLTHYNKTSNQYEINLPDVEASYYPDESTFQKIDEYQKKDYTGSTNIGQQEWISAERESAKKIQNEFNNDASLKSIARENARAQITTLASALMPDKKIVVRFLDEVQR